MIGEFCILITSQIVFGSNVQEAIRFQPFQICPHRQAGAVGQEQFSVPQHGFCGKIVLHVFGIGTVEFNGFPRPEQRPDEDAGEVVLPAGDPAAPAGDIQPLLPDGGRQRPDLFH